MKKIFLVAFTVLMISSCSMFSKQASDKMMIVVNYKNDTLEVDNYNGKSFNMRVINAIPNSKKYKVSNSVLVNDGSHLYKLHSNKMGKESVDNLLNNPEKNTMYVYTAVTPNKDIEDAYSISYRNLSTVNLDGSDGIVLFNSLNTDNFFKVSGISSSRDGGVSNLEISTLVALDSDKTITIGGIPEFKESTLEISPLECASMGTACDDGRNH